MHPFKKSECIFSRKKISISQERLKLCGRILGWRGDKLILSEIEGKPQRYLKTQYYNKDSLTFLVSRVYAFKPSEF